MTSLSENTLRHPFPGSLSLKDSTTLCLLNYIHACTHANTQTTSVYKCYIHINMHINHRDLNFMWACTIGATSTDTGDSTNALKSHKLSLKCGKQMAAYYWDAVHVTVGTVVHFAKDTVCLQQKLENMSEQ